MMNKIQPTCLTFCLALFIISGLSTQAHAGQVQDNANACRAAINATMGLETGVSSELYYKLKKIRGNQIQMLIYRARTNEGISKIICSVKRAKVLELTDGDRKPIK